MLFHVHQGEGRPQSRDPAVEELRLARRVVPVHQERCELGLSGIAPLGVGVHHPESAAGVEADERCVPRLLVQEQQVERGLATLSWFIHRFTTPAMRNLFANPRNDLQLEQAMISMLAGDVFRDNGVHWRLGVFKAIYFATALGDLRAQARAFQYPAINPAIWSASGSRSSNPSTASR